MCLPGTVEAVREQIEKEGVPRVDRRTVLAGGAGAAIAAMFPGTASAQRISAGRVENLTHVFTAGFPVFTGASPSRTTIANFTPNGFYAQAWTFGEHSGTHLDAPGHFTPGGRLSPDIRPRELILDFFGEGGRHISAEGLYLALCERGEKISLSTVYLNLGVLKSAGLSHAIYCATHRKKQRFCSVNIMH
jgi:hypothetical protein